MQWRLSLHAVLNDVVLQCYSMQSLLDIELSTMYLQSYYVVPVILSFQTRRYTTILQVPVHQRWPLQPANTTQSCRFSKLGALTTDMQPSSCLSMTCNPRGDGQSLRELCAGLSIARQSVSKHLAVLEAANLVTTTRLGRRKLAHLNAQPIRTIAQRWIVQYGQTPESTPNEWIDWHDALVQP